jgi:AraC-like DNA-binding protein
VRICVEQPPSEDLRLLIRRFLVVEFPETCHDCHLPDTQPVMAFSIGGACQLQDQGWAPKAAFTALKETLHAHKHSQHHAVLIATFTPAGASAILGPRMNELRGRTVDLAAVADAPSRVERLLGQLSETASWPGRIAHLETFLRSQARTFVPDPLVAAAVTRIEQHASSLRIATLSKYTGLSQSALERRFRRVIGVSPGRFASIVRLRQAVTLWKAGVDGATAALQAGYFDQAHFINAFRQATGVSPTRLLGARANA